MNLTTHITSRLTEFGLARPPANLVEKLEESLDKQVAKIVERCLTRKLIARCFSEILTEPQVRGSAEGVTPSAQQDNGVSQDMTLSVAGERQEGRETTE